LIKKRRILIISIITLLLITGLTAYARVEITALNRNFFVTGGHGVGYNIGQWSRVRVHTTINNNINMGSIFVNNVYRISARSGPHISDSTVGVNTLTGVTRFVQHIGNSFSAPLSNHNLNELILEK